MFFITFDGLIKLKCKNILPKVNEDYDLYFNKLYPHHKEYLDNGCCPFCKGFRSLDVVIKHDPVLHLFCGCNECGYKCTMDVNGSDGFSTEIHKNIKRLNKKIKYLKKQLSLKESNLKLKDQKIKSLLLQEEILFGRLAKPKYKESINYRVAPEKVVYNYDDYNILREVPIEEELELLDSEKRFYQNT